MSPWQFTHAQTIVSGGPRTLNAILTRTAFGYFNAYGNTVRKDSVDYVLHLGDYIYEYGNGEYGWGNALGRIPQPDRQILTLYDYRRRHAQYRTDLDLVASHQNYPWIPVWDDHGKIRMQHPPAKSN